MLVLGQVGVSPTFCNKHYVKRIYIMELLGLEVIEIEKLKIVPYGEGSKRIPSHTGLSLL
jgi:hypothetical protein